MWPFPCLLNCMLVKCACLSDAYSASQWVGLTNEMGPLCGGSIHGILLGKSCLAPLAHKHQAVFGTGARRTLWLHLHWHCQDRTEQGHGGCPTQETSCMDTCDLCHAVSVWGEEGALGRSPSRMTRRKKLHIQSPWFSTKRAMWITRKEFKFVWHRSLDLI